VRRTRREDRGQATVEFALVLPLVVLLLLLVAQVGLVVREQILLTHAAREAARAASVTDGDRVGAARRAALRSGPLSADRLSEEVLVTDDGGSVRVSLRYRSRTDLPLVGMLVPDPALGSSAVMRLESAVEDTP